MRKKAKAKRPKRINKRKQAKRDRRKLDMEWREAVVARDRVCVICGEPDKPNAHHIIPREVKSLRHDVMNGIALCSGCHRFRTTCSPHKNAFVFLWWLQRNRPEQFKYLTMKVEEMVTSPEWAGADLVSRTRTGQKCRRRR